MVSEEVIYWCKSVLYFSNIGFSLYVVFEGLEDTECAVACATKHK